MMRGPGLQQSAGAEGRLIVILAAGSRLATGRSWPAGRLAGRPAGQPAGQATGIFREEGGFQEAGEAGWQETGSGRQSLAG